MHWVKGRETTKVEIINDPLLIKSDPFHPSTSIITATMENISSCHVCTEPHEGSVCSCTNTKS